MDVVWLALAAALWALTWVLMLGLDRLMEPAASPRPDAGSGADA
jgi:hypothetical protein